MNGTTQTGPHLRRAVRGYVRAYASLHGRRKAAEDFGVSRHTLWRFLERGHMGRAVPSAVLSSADGTSSIPYSLPSFREMAAVAQSRYPIMLAASLLIRVPARQAGEGNRHRS